MTTAEVLSEAWQFHEAGDLAQAETRYRQVLDAEPGNTSALYLLGVVCQVQGRVTEAMSLYQQCLQGKPEFPEVHNNLGLLHASRGEWDQAIALYCQALILNPRYPEALSNLGIAHFQQHRVEQAIRCFREALGARPDYAEAHNNFGNVLLDQGKPREAEACYRKALRLQPDNAETWSNLGVARKDQGHASEAVAALQQSLKLDPNDIRTYRNLGSVFNDLGRYAEARSCYERILALTPENAEARFLVEALGATAPPARAPADYVANLFDSYADSFDRELVDRLRYRGPELLKEALGDAPPARGLAVLDLGCGTGLCGLEFREWASSLTGVDLSPQMLEKARARGVYDHLIAGDLLVPLQQGESHYDLILAGDVLTYLGDLEPLFQAVQRAIRPGGRFAFTVERLEGNGYRLLPSVRFAHARSYVHEVATRAGLREEHVHEAVLRTEGGQGIAALVVVLSRPPS